MAEKNLTATEVTMRAQTYARKERRLLKKLDKVCRETLAAMLNKYSCLLGIHAWRREGICGVCVCSLCGKINVEKS